MKLFSLIIWTERMIVAVLEFFKEANELAEKNSASGVVPTHAAPLHEKKSAPPIKKPSGPVKAKPDPTIKESLTVQNETTQEAIDKRQKETLREMRQRLHKEALQAQELPRMNLQENSDD